jgi:hydrogenase maturation factor
VCLSQLVRIEQIDSDGVRAIGRSGDRQIAVSLAVLTVAGDTPEPGDWVLAATGLAVRRLSYEEVLAITDARLGLNEEERS